MALNGVLDHLLAGSRIHEFWIWKRRRNAPDRGRIVLTQRRVYILPTGYGFTFGAALALMLVGSINYNLALGYILTFLLAGMGIVSILHTFRNLAHLVVVPGRAEPVFAGANACFNLYAENGRREPRCALRFVCGDASVTVTVPGGGSAQVALDVPAPQRGWLRLPRVTVETRYPLGLFRAWSYVQPDMQVLVYPKPDGAPLPPPRPRSDNGDAASAGSGNDDFAGLREYQASDSPRHIAWKAVARGDALLTKTFSGRAARELVFDWDELPAGLEVEARLSRLTRWVLLAHESGAAFGLRLSGEEIAAGTGADHLRRCLQALALHGR